MVPVLCIALGCRNSNANDVYIAQFATGLGGGSDCENALPYNFFNNAGKWSGVTGTGDAIGPGTTVHLCGIFTGPIGGTSPFLRFQGSGTTANPIRLLFEPNAVITSAYWGTTVIDIGNVSNVIVDGGSNGLIQATLGGSPGALCLEGACQYSPTTYAGAGVGIGASNNVEIKKVTVSNLYIHLGTGDDLNGNSAGIAIGGLGSDISIHDNIIHDVYAGIWAQYDERKESNYSIYGNHIYNVNWGIAGGDARAGSSLSGLLVYGNQIHDFVNWNTSSNTFHHDGIFFWAQQTGSSIRAPIAIYNNTIYGNFGSANCTAGLYLQKGYSGQTIDSVFVFNNVIDISGWCGYGVIALNNIQSNSQIFNNTLSNGLLFGPSGQGSAAVLANNVWLSAQPGQGMYSTEAGIQASDYNDWYNLSVNAFYYNSMWYKSLANWRTSTGFDQNSITLFPNLNLAYQPRLGSPLIGAGKNLTSICSGQPNPGIGALCFDAAGRPRHASEAWDIGAYQGARPAPAPPSGLRADPH